MKMISQQVLDLKGNRLGEIGLDDNIFGIEPNQGLLHAALVRQLKNARAGTASTKTRSEVAGGGRKPWRQKGTGRARAGSIRSPLWEGGGVIFGPKPRSHAIAMPKKMRVLAVKSALAARKNNMLVVKNFDDIKNGKTKEMAQALKDLKIYGQKVLLVLDYTSEQSPKVYLASRNISGVKVLHLNNLNVKDLMDCHVVLTTERAIEAISTRFKSERESPRRATKGETRAKAKYHGTDRTSDEAKASRPKLKPATAKQDSEQKQATTDSPSSKVEAKESTGKTVKSDNQQPEHEKREVQATHKPKKEAKSEETQEKNPKRKPKSQA